MDKYSHLININMEISSKHVHVLLHVISSNIHYITMHYIYNTYSRLFIKLA